MTRHKGFHDAPRCQITHRANHEHNEVSGFRCFLERIGEGTGDQLHNDTAEPACQKYQSGDWITECETEGGAPDCSLMVRFSKAENGQKGAFALAVMVSTGDIAIVGQPVPVRAVLRIGNNLPIGCRETQYCLFPREQSIAAIGQISSASVILVDVLTAKASFKFSLTTRGYQAGLAQVRAWGYFAN